MQTEAFLSGLNEQDHSRVVNPRAERSTRIRLRPSTSPIDADWSSRGLSYIERTASSLCKPRETSRCNL
jgi:hypothetical protein